MGPLDAPFDDDLPDRSDGVQGVRAARRRALTAFAAFAAGLLTARSIPTAPAGTWFAIACGTLAIAAIAQARLSSGASARACRIGMAALTLGLFFASAGWFAARIHERSADHIAALLGETRDSPPVIRLDGIVTEPPSAVRSPGSAPEGSEVAWRTTLQVTAVAASGGWLPAGGRVQVVGPGAPPVSVAVGAHLRITGRYLGVAPPTNPGEPDRRQFAAQQGAGGTLRVPSNELVTAADAPLSTVQSIGALWCWSVASLRASARHALDASAAAADPRTSAVLAALLLGEYDPGADDVTDAFTRAGLVHVLAISGFHLVVMAGVVLVLVRLTGDRGWIEPAVVAVMVLLYILIVPANAPVVRAGVMVLALLAAEAFGRRYDRLTTLAWIAIALLIWRPLDLWSLGWQLSFGIVATLLWTGRRFHDRLFPPGLRGVVRTRPPRWRRGPGGLLADSAGAALGGFKRLLSTSVLCWLVAMPLIAWHTGSISPIAVAASLVVVPLATVLLWLGFAALLVGTVAPPAAPVVGWVLVRVAEMTAGLVLWLDGWSGVWRIPPVSIAWTVAATAAVLWLARRAPWSARSTWAVLAALLAWLAVEGWAGPRLADGSLRGRTVLRIDAFDVGNGTCWLLRSGGEAVIWDCGSATGRPSLWKRTVSRAIRALGAGRVHRIVVSGAAADRLSGLAALAQSLGVSEILTTPTVAAAAAAPSSPAAVQLRAAEAGGVTVSTIRAGDAFRIGRAQVAVLWPPAAAAEPVAGEDRSLIARLSVATSAGARTVWMVGDNGSAVLRRALADAGAVDVLEWPRGRIEADDAAALVIRLAPEVVVESGSRRTRAGTARTGGRWLVTQSHGAAWVEFRADGSIVEGTFRGPDAGAAEPGY